MKAICVSERKDTQRASPSFELRGRKRTRTVVEQEGGTDEASALSAMLDQLFCLSAVKVLVEVVAQEIVQK